MGTRLTTSKKTKEIFEELGAKTNLKPFALSKIAIVLSLKEAEPIENYEADNSEGLQLHRHTITAHYDALFKALIEQHANKKLSDDEYFPKYTKLHLDRGAEILKNKFAYAKNLENFIFQMIKGDMQI